MTNRTKIAPLIILICLCLLNACKNEVTSDDNEIVVSTNGIVGGEIQKLTDLAVETNTVASTNNLTSTNDVSTSIAQNAGILENQRDPSLLDDIGDSLKDPDPLATDPDYLTVNFNKLASFDFVIPDEHMFIEEGDAPIKDAPTIPENIQKLDGEKVAVTGFMLPLKVENGLVTELLLMRDLSMCCYGTVPEINEWISLKAKDAESGFKPYNDQAVTFFGNLKVGEVRENGYLVGIYEMTAERMVGPDQIKDL